MFWLILFAAGIGNIYLGENCSAERGQTYNWLHNINTAKMKLLFPAGLWKPAKLNRLFLCNCITNWTIGRMNDEWKDAFFLDLLMIACFRANVAWFSVSFFACSWIYFGNQKNTTLTPTEQPLIGSVFNQS